MESKKADFYFLTYVISGILGSFCLLYSLQIHFLFWIWVALTPICLISLSKATYYYHLKPCRKEKGIWYLSCDNDHNLVIETGHFTGSLGRQIARKEDFINNYFEGTIGAKLYHDKIEKIKTQDLLAKIKFKKVKEIIQTNEKNICIGDIYKSLIGECTFQNIDFVKFYFIFKIIETKYIPEDSIIIFLGTRVSYNGIFDIIFVKKPKEEKAYNGTLSFRDFISTDSYIAIVE